MLFRVSRLISTGWGNTPHSAVHLERSDAVAILFMQLRCNQESIPSDPVVFGFPFDTFILIGRERELFVFPVYMAIFLSLQAATDSRGNWCGMLPTPSGHLPVFELDQAAAASYSASA